MVKGRRRNEQILARHRAVTSLQLPKWLFPSNQHWFRQFLSRRSESSSNITKPGRKANLVGYRSLVQSELKLGEGNNAQNAGPFAGAVNECVLGEPSRRPRRFRASASGAPGEQQMKM
jgi:hypothetical protein